MLFQKWTRADLDVKAGGKGAASYWDEVAKLFNDKSYVPEECAEFKVHVASCGTAASYSTGLVPEYRHGSCLRTRWTVLRSASTAGARKADITSQIPRCTRPTFMGGAEAIKS